ncbi:hypothetical protein Taro_038602 [Colocasia esculenta]|uniref:Uncharacterized protein n=1 Tax=Colocasia esculenta TaxID=4460 RepID=A0A843WGB5_COLES|nr:hypothetical protein [Colocasia esculenta]
MTGVASGVPDATVIRVTTGRSVAFLSRPGLPSRSAWRWLVVNSSEVLLEFFSVGSGGNEVSPELTVCCCPGEGFSRDRFALVSVVAVLPQSLRYAASVGLAGAFWRVFPERCLGGSGGGSPRTGLCCFCSSACCGVLSNGPCRWVVHPGEGSSQDRPLSLLVEVLPRSALCLFRATVCCPCGLKCVVWLSCVLVRFSQDGSWRFWWRFSPKLFRAVWLSLLSRCVGGTSCVPVLRAVCFVSRARCALADGGLVSAFGARLAVLLVEAPVLRCGLPLARGRDSLRCVSPSSVFRWLLEVVMLHSACSPRAVVSVWHHGSVDLFVSFVVEMGSSLRWALYHLGPLVPLCVLHLERFLRCFVFCASRAGADVACCALLAFRFVPSGALVHRVVSWVAPGACDSTSCCAVCLFAKFVALSVVHHVLIVASVSVFPLALGASVFGCGTLPRSGSLRGRRAVLDLCSYFGFRVVACLSGVWKPLAESPVGPSVDLLWLRVSLVSLSDHEEEPFAVVLVRVSLGTVSASVLSLWFCVSCVAVGNCVVCRVLLATEWVADRLGPTAESVGGCNRVVFGWCFLLFRPDLASLGTGGVVVPVGRPTCGWSEPLVPRLSAPGEEEGRSWCLGVVERAWSEEEVFFPTRRALRVTREAHPYFFQVRESRRLLVPLLVQSRTIAELGLHHQ